MSKVSLRTLGAHKVRLALTLISVLLGTAFVAGSFVFTDTLERSFNHIFDTADKGIDAQVQPANPYDPGVPITLVPRLQQVPGAAVVEPTITAPIVLVGPDGKKIESNGAPSEGGAWSSTSVNPVPTFSSGHAPQAAGEVVINRGAATQHGLHTGDQVKVVVSNARIVQVRISGIYETSYDTGGYLGALFERAQALKLFTDGSHYSTVNVAAASGVSEQTLTARIDRVLPAGLQVKTGDQVRSDETQGIADALAFVTYILLGFGIVALLVGTFIIYNTFTMIVAQRQRELALLRAIGASRKQVRRSVVTEAGVIGLVGSALGLAGGIGLAIALRAVLNAFDLGLPSGALVLSPRTVIVTLVLGTLVTLLAANTPARRASRIAPVAAMQEEFAAPSAGSLRRRTVGGVVVAALGGLATVAGVVSDSAGSSASFIGLGLVAVCAAAMLLSPVFARWIIVPLGRVVGAPFGAVGRLARTNAVRNPRRTAATGFALTLGLVLVAGISVLGSSVKTSLAGIVDDTVTADYIVTTTGQLDVPQPAANAVATVPGVATSTQIHGLDVTIDGHHQFGSAVDGPLTPVLAISMRSGTADTSGDHIVISAKKAAQTSWRLGERLHLTAPGVTPTTVTVSGIYADNELLGPFLTSGEVYRHVTPRNTWSSYVVLVDAARGTDLAALRSNLESAMNKYYVVTVEDRAGFKGSIAGQVDGLIGLLYGLLALAIVIAVLGIVNTLALSVVERRREIGMLRAVGMQRKQVRRTIYLESLLIAVFGAVLGLIVGIAYGSLFTHSLHTAGIDRLSIPWAQSGVFLALAAAVGVLAALWPGVRAARTSPLAAISGG